MQIHAFGLSRVPTFLGQWDLDFDGRTDVFSIPLTGEKSIALFLDALKFALFDISSEKLGKIPKSAWSSPQKRDDLNFFGPTKTLKSAKTHAV